MNERAAKRVGASSSSKGKPGASVVRVAIVGGGCAGLAAAWQLTRLNDPAHTAALRAPADPRQRKGGAAKPSGQPAMTYEITVYEAASLLGGKGASYRDEHGRIIEHGLHVWLGFYENAFRMMRECYAEVAQAGWGPDAKAGEQRLVHGSFDDAFTPEPHIGVAARRHEAWEVWTAFLPPMKGQPGDPIRDEDNPFTLWGYLARALALVKSLLQSVVGPPQAEGDDGPGLFDRSRLDEAQELDFAFDPAESPDAVVERLASMARTVLLASAAGVLQAAAFIESLLRERNPAPQIATSLLKVIEALATNTRRQLEDVVTIDEELRRKTEILDLIMTILIGLYRDRVFLDPRGLDKIDDIDYREWLERHGATRGALDSPLVAGIYDLVFAYRDGDHKRPALSAAQALRGAMRMFLSYRGSMFWRMNSGMGDAVFAPLYCVLQRREVKFEFGRRLESITFRDRRVAALAFEGHSPDAGLDPQGCWPSPAAGTSARAAAAGIPTSAAAAGMTTRAGRSKRAAAASLRLEAGKDFDAVILATGIDDLAAVCKGSNVDPFEKDRAWKRARQYVKTVATRSAQVWMSKTLPQLGWDRGPVVLAGIDVPTRAERNAGKGRREAPPRLFETWADMTHLLTAERAHRASRAGGASAPGNAAAPDQVRSIAYFCGVLPHKRAPDDRESGRDALKLFLADRMRFAWPRAYREAGESGARSPLDFLVTADAKATGGTLNDTHVVDNTGDGQLYTQSLPGSGTARISPLDPGFDNMTIAGDWTDCGFNGACVEAAVMSGLLAAHAISGDGDLNDIVGYHHP